MKKEKVTIQDIADALGISRNTASKAINGSDSIPVDTRNKVIKKAIELKYKQFAYVETDSIIPRNQGNIALFTCNLPNSSHFGSFLISGLEKRISAEGYNLSIHIVRENETQAGTLPNNFEASKVDGIICIEMFDPQYSELVTSLGLPTIFIDCSVDIFCPDLKADLLLMENEHSVYFVTKSLIDRGFARIGFAGDYKHCKSFNERWVGYNRALIEAGLSVDLSCCIVDQDRNFFSESDWMDKQLEGMSALPSAFVCANDFIAVSVMKALKNKNLKIPEDIAVFGFDNAPESRIVEPHLSTVHIYNNEMGITAAEMLLARVKDPSRPYQITHIRTEPIFRESTPTLQ
ncbi:substrate-binding domain-containing protein [Paenibacillus polymyxa]|uniref:LacI family transcriptional regulator n=1 Tax=Paenibacillus polymyxa (strain SC2) TaxID=886882 RepID=E3EEA8_PAEPS|nr:substrate-binding domain-containing protein [Paenibacillus polymyxa]ADO55031.1 LacI family transcriptional regulator [Paenibacillus polymyxa SC2]WPQ57863.1 substrate-binding domain-containing protein [Paenibacillus polymyxa]CCC83902.1 HTH-type transcriptional repressor purR Purine nucleotide synthesis repressor; Pur regulon repressor [Paenibacillus polymyxa M1]